MLNINDLKINISKSDTIYDDVEEYHTTWGEILKISKNPLIVEDKKEAPVWMCGRFIGNKRVESDVYEISLFICDFDNKHGNVIKLNVIQKVLKNFTYLAHTSFSHSIENERWRVIIPLKKAFNSDYLIWFYKWLNKRFKGELDPVCKSASHPFFLPIKREDSRLYHYFSNEGELLDINHIGISEDLVNDILTDGTLNSIWNGDGFTCKDDSSSGLVFNMIRILKKKGYDEVEVRRLMTFYWDHGRNSQRELDLAFRKVYSKPSVSRKISCISLGDVEEMKVEWLWYPYIPFGKITILSGDPSIGKSYISLAIAANLSSGTPLPSGKVVEAKTLLFLAEDDLADTTRPRLRKLGANLNNVHAARGDFQLDEQGFEELEKVIKEHNFKFIVFDPIFAFMGGGVDIHKEVDSRACMNQLKTLAEDLRVAILLIRHFTKSSKDKTIYKGMGSIAFSAAARSELSVTAYNGHRVLSHVKSSLAPTGVSIYYHLTETKEGEMPDFVWGQTTSKTAEEIDLETKIQAANLVVNEKEKKKAAKRKKKSAIENKIDKS